MRLLCARSDHLPPSKVDVVQGERRLTEALERSPVVAPLQLIFLASWRHKGGRLPTDDATLERWFPASTLDVPSDAAFHAPSTLLWNVPGTGHHPISDAIEASIETATERIEIVNRLGGRRRARVAGRDPHPPHHLVPGQAPGQGMLARP